MREVKISAEFLFSAPEKDEFRAQLGRVVFVKTTRPDKVAPNVILKEIIPE